MKTYFDDDGNPKVRYSMKTYFDDDGNPKVSSGPRSIYVVLRYADNVSDYFCSIVRLDPLPLEIIKNPPLKKIYAKYVAHFRRAPRVPPLLKWAFVPPASSTDDLYILPDWPRRSPKYVPLHGFTFSCSTNRFQEIKKPHLCKLGGPAVTVGRNIYSMAHPSWYGQPPLLGATVFERYDPANQLWEPQVPFPVHLNRGSIQATAVWDDTILLNMDDCEIWAYNVSNCKWYPVNVLEDDLGDDEPEEYDSNLEEYDSDDNYNPCYDIEGEAIVVGNIIYALSNQFPNVVLALSIEKKDGVDGGDLEYSCYFHSECTMPPMERYGKAGMCGRTRSLVHLGDDSLCFVQSCRYFEVVETQPIQVTYIKLMRDGEMAETDQCCYHVKLAYQQFTMGSCFSLPECKTAALKPCETFIFDPVSGDVSKEGDIQFERSVALTRQEVSYVFVINLPPDATAEQLEKSLKKFGNLKSGTIQLIRHTTGNCAIVEFGSVTSMRHAIKASPIRIGGCEADILKLSGTSFAKAAAAAERTIKRKR